MDTHKQQTDDSCCLIHLSADSEWLLKRVSFSCFSVWLLVFRLQHSPAVPGVRFHEDKVSILLLCPFSIHRFSFRNHPHNKTKKEKHADWRHHAPSSRESSLFSCDHSSQPTGFISKPPSNPTQRKKTRRTGGFMPSSTREAQPSDAKYRNSSRLLASSFSHSAAADQTCRAYLLPPPLRGFVPISPKFHTASSHLVSIQRVSRLRPLDPD